MMSPVVAPAGTVTVICVELLETMWAFTPLNLTVLTPVNAVPVITTLVPMGPLGGENDVITGFTLNAVLDTACPDAVVSVMGPEVAPEGTLAVIVESFTRLPLKPRHR